MKIILMTGYNKSYEKSTQNIANFIQNTYNVKYIYHAHNKGSIFTRNMLQKTLNRPEITVVPNKSLNIKYKSDVKVTDISDVDLWDRTEKYQNTIKSMRNDSDEDIAKRLRSFYENLLSLHLPNEKYDIVVIANELIISSFVEELYRINKYYTYRNIGCFISVINTANNLLDIHKFHIS
jgi:hypothetical protein